MTHNIQFITDFARSRSRKIGASEIASCIPHPERAGSVAGYDQTALTVWQEKTGRIKRDPAGFPAEMGHVLEPVILKKWLSENTDDETAARFYRGYALCELEKTNDGYPNAEQYQTTGYLHHTRAESDFAIAHADLIHPLVGIITEAKSASFWSSRRGDDPHNGYDPDLKSNQGIPLKVFFQVQFQAALYQLVYGLKIELLNIALIFDTSQYHSWTVKPETKIQERLLEIASYMKKCIDNDTPPKTLAMSQSDIKIMYPKIEEDYRIISGDEMTRAVELARGADEAARQVKKWTAIKDEHADALSIILKDTKTIKGIIDGEIVDIASWQERTGAERIIPLSEIKKDDRLYKYMVENELIKKSDDSRFVKIKIKDGIK